MDLGVAGKSVFFTGGSKGMGRVAAGMLAAEGANVAIVGRNESDVDRAVEEIRSGGGTALGVPADITDESEVARAVGDVTAAFGPPLIVVGQTKFIRSGDFADIDNLEHYVESFRTYTMSQLYLLHAVLPAMKEAGWGRFVHIGSATAKEPVGAIAHAVANATRPSTIGLLKTVADEYARYGITVNTVAPGWILTENTERYTAGHLGLTTNEARHEWVTEHVHVPAGRMGRPEEIASLIAYLCSDLAGYMTGNWIEVDGGLHRSAF
ncbi:SDR family oxidoreductase [Acidiferrimicrobium sp. IK]|uniref:SDR family oxidoreductase n=1 Tax=Acidiferrimicrobium sp. IK TaxID=2871700 RepID=UPI0021CAFE6C|nr:SDR family oxidoreductase [Acidiferrimicrobium sp. IK]MCU4183318.1 SDR family oxidoreductase [Acidiferrimicrobium sp. IK]